MPNHTILGADHPFHTMLPSSSHNGLSDSEAEVAAALEKKIMENPHLGPAYLQTHAKVDSASLPIHEGRVSESPHIKYIG